MAASGSPMMTIAKHLYRAMPLPLRKACFQAYSSSVRGSVRRKDFGGYVAELHLGEMMEISAYLDEFEPEVRELIDRFAEPGQTALDVGANVGLHGLRIASRVGPKGKVYAFEPTDFSYRKLSKNASLNSHLNLIPLQLALSNVNDPGAKIDFRTSWGTDGGRSDNEPTIVDFVRLDDWARASDLGRLDLIKIDVDGYEGFAIEGGLETVSKFRPVILMEAYGGQFLPGRPDAFALLETIGYSFWTAKEGEKISASDVRPRLDSLKSVNAESFNVYALPAKAV